MYICSNQVQAQIDLTCTYGNRTYDSVVYYSCNLARTLVLENFHEIRIGGLHLEDKTDIDVTGLYITYSKMTFITSKLLLKFPNLKYFQMLYTELEHLTGSALSGAPNLEVVDMTYGNLKTLDEDSFVGLRKLTTIRLQVNNISNLPTTIFHSLRNLTIINVDNNQITRLHNDMFLQNGQRVSQFLARSNQIIEIGPNFVDNLVALDHLYFSNNNCSNSIFLRNNAGRMDFVAVRNALATCFSNYLKTPTEVEATAGKLSTLLLE